MMGDQERRVLSTLQTCLDRIKQNQSRKQERFIINDGKSVILYYSPSSKYSDTALNVGVYILHFVNHFMRGKMLIISMLIVLYLKRI